MHVKSSLYKPFVKALNDIVDKYGEKILELSGIGNAQLDTSMFMNNLIDMAAIADISIDPNSNISSQDMDTVLNEAHKPLFKLKSYERLFKDYTKLYGIKEAEEWFESEITGKLYLHDAHEASYKAYCYGYSCMEISKRGMFFDQSLKAEPAKHLETFNQHILEFIRFATKRQSGAIGIGDYLIWSYYFYKEDKRNKHFGITDFDKYATQQFQMFIYAVNQSGAKASQSAFTNVSIFDRNYLYEIFFDQTYPNGEKITDFVEEIIEYQKLFLNFLKKERSKKLLTFPVLNAALLFQDNKFVDAEFARFCTDHIYLWKDLPITAEDSVTSTANCCRLKSDMRELVKFNSITGSSSEIGSIKVSTINLNRIALDTNKSKNEFITELTNRIRLTLHILNAQRYRIQKNIEKGIMPLYELGLMKLTHQYSTIGIASFSNMMETLGFLKTDKFNNQYYTEDGYAFGKRIFLTIQQIIKEANLPYMINIEQVPAEGASISLVKKDKYFHGQDSIDVSLYSNQWLGLDKSSTLQEKIKSASVFDKYCSGGSMLFVNIEGEFANTDQVWDLVNHIASQGVTTINIVTNINICENEHNYREKTNTCPICGANKVDETTKVVGFYTRKSNWQKERREEDRKWFNFDNSEIKKDDEAIGSETFHENPPPEKSSKFSIEDEENVD